MSAEEDFRYASIAIIDGAHPRDLPVGGSKLSDIEFERLDPFPTPIPRLSETDLLLTAIYDVAPHMSEEVFPETVAGALFDCSESRLKDAARRQTLIEKFEVLAQAMVKRGHNQFLARSPFFAIYMIDSEAVLLDDEFSIVSNHVNYLVRSALRPRAGQDAVVDKFCVQHPLSTHAPRILLEQTLKEIRTVLIRDRNRLGA